MEEVLAIAVPLELYTLELLAGETLIDSSPTGSPVRFRNMRITVSPPARAPALPSEALLFFLILRMVALVATPPLRLNVRVRSEVANAPEPLFALYAPAVKVTSAYELSFATAIDSKQNPIHASITTFPSLLHTPPSLL